MWESVVISGHQWPSEIIIGNQGTSVALIGNGYLGEVHGQVEVVVGERAVLGGVEHLMREAIRLR